MSIVSKVQGVIARVMDVRLSGPVQISHREAMLYARDADFLRIFVKDMRSLYWLSFFLTAEHSMAERCFVRAMENSNRDTHVFKEWTQSWARRTIIRTAIQMIGPQPADSRRLGSMSDRRADRGITLPADIASIVGLPQFERFVFVMSVLERHSDQECSLLLDCTRGDVIAARIRVLQQVAKVEELARKVVSIGLDEQAPQDILGSRQPDAVRGEEAGLPGIVSPRAGTRWA